MFGAIGGLLGGGGAGGIGSLLGGIGGNLIGGPIGGMIGSTLGSMVDDAVGNATKDASRQLVREDGMPKFIDDLVQTKVDDVMAGLTLVKPHGDTKTHCEQEYGDIFKDFQNELTQAIVSAVRNEIKSNADATDGTSGSKSSGGSWLQAIARAMGTVMGEKASKMVELSQKIQAQTAAKSEGSKEDQMAAASEAQKLNTEFQATGQEFNLLQTTFSTAIKTMGEGMASIARKQ